MATMRTYGDGCSIAHGLDLVGERWALLVVRELLLSPKRYTDLRRGLPNASPNVLSDRLRELEERGIVTRRKLPPPVSVKVYELTEWGRELEPVVLSLGQWAARSPSRPSDAPIVSGDSVVLALRTMFDADAAHGVRASYGVRFGEDHFRIDIADDALHVARGGAEGADVTIDTDPGTLDAVLWGGRSLADAQRSGDLTIAGDHGAVERLIRLVPMPGPAAA